MKDYPWPFELAYFCYKVAKSRGWCLDEALQLLAWNSVIQRWRWKRTWKAAELLIGAWGNTT